MIDYSSLYARMLGTKLESWRKTLPNHLERSFSEKAHGDLPNWLRLLESLPKLSPSYVDFAVDTVCAGDATDSDTETLRRIEVTLRQLHPWRKGPYRLFGIHIDSEWRSDWKWNRLRDSIRPLRGRLVLDVGCGNGYHCWRMAGMGAKLTLGIDPSFLFITQFHAVRHFMGDWPVFALPLALEDLPEKLNAFDTVFSMGVMAHRRSPLDHLFGLGSCLRSGGELVLETLVIDGFEGQTLVPRERYAMMRNVWFIPSCDTLLGWLQRCGYRNARIIDVTKTTTKEQRSTNWMHFQSLSDFLRPDNPDLTLEGLPAPKRAIFIAEKP